MNTQQNYIISITVKWNRQCDNVDVFKNTNNNDNNNNLYYWYKEKDSCISISFTEDETVKIRQKKLYVQLENKNYWPVPPRTAHPSSSPKTLITPEISTYKIIVWKRNGVSRWLEVRASGRWWGLRPQHSKGEITFTRRFCQKDHRHKIQ